MKDKILTVVLVVVVLGALALLPLYNHWAYNDWTCVVKNCVQVKENE